MPILKEIGIDSHGLTREMDHQFRLQSRHVAALIERHLPKFKTPDFWKILIVCCDSKPEQYKSFTVIGGVMDVYLACEILSFFALPENEKKKFVFEVICRGLESVTKHCGLGQVEFSSAIKASRDLVNEWHWPHSPISSPNRKWRASLWCQHEINRFAASLVVMDKQQNKVASSLVFEAPPSEFQFVPRMCEPSWSSNDELIVGDQTWEWNGIELRLKKKLRHKKL
jgi:hypothetical protein